MYQNYSYDEWVEWIARLPERGAKGFTTKIMDPHSRKPPTWQPVSCISYETTTMKMLAELLPIF